MKTSWLENFDNGPNEDGFQRRLRLNVKEDRTTQSKDSDERDYEVNDNDMQLSIFYFWNYYVKLIVFEKPLLSEKIICK